MPYVGLLPALAHGRPILIVGFDPTHVLAIDTEGRFRYIEHNDIEVPLYGNADALLWMENAAAWEDRGVDHRSDSDVASDDAAVGESDESDAR